MRVLITGGAGFIGSHLADRLLARGDDVLVIDNLATGRVANLAESPKLTFIEASIADAQVVSDAFAGFRPDHVVHAAASYKDPENWVEDTRTNVLGTVNVVNAARQFPAGRFVYFQTALCYGGQPLEQPITLAHPIRPESSYAISKTAGEQYIALSGLEFLSFRLANAYGPRNVSGPLPTFYQRLSTGKKCFVMNTRRDFIYVDDLVDVVEKALAGWGSSGYYHISSGADFAIKELYDETIRAMALEGLDEVEVRERGADDVLSILLDPSKTNRDFVWSVSTPLRDGVERTVASYRPFGIGETYTHLRVASE
ncbi:MAG: NAD-dependent epimerase/dehydratase family protein [Thermomicrobiales bacterium]|nr:NAD-dependent epimerase/dehydratase family protein [Thermomicrobiales bacterium]